MGTFITPELAKSNRYRIPKHRYYELKHFCLQYRDWKARYLELEEDLGMISPRLSSMPRNKIFSDKTAEIAIERESLSGKIKLIEDLAKKADPDIYKYILKSVTEDLSFVILKTIYELPCERDMFYDRRRKFFWLLNSARK